MLFLCVCFQRSFVDGCQIKLYSNSSSGNLRIMENGDVNGLGGNGKRGEFVCSCTCRIMAGSSPLYSATFTVHVKGLRQVALQNAKNPDLWLQVKDDELSGNVCQWHEIRTLTRYISNCYISCYLSHLIIVSTTK